jgi:two-component system response regulator AtoC
MAGSTLLVEDDRSFSSLAAAVLRREGMTVTLARSLHEARVALSEDAPEIVILDRRLPDGDGMEFLPEVRARVPAAAILVVTAHGDIASAVEAMRLGATDYLTKPVELADLVMKAQRSLASLRLHDRLEQAEAQISSRFGLIRPRSAAMSRIIDLLERVAGSPRSPVLLLGETGSGKEVLARHLHDRAAGPEAPFIHLNCAALPESTFESELFGHERGAFTDARAARRGLVEAAHGGTLFLDEVGEMPLALQAKLLTFLDSGRFRRLGGTTEHESSARVVAATNRDLEEQIRTSAFRQDLWFRLGVFRIDVPPLRERREDVVPLAHALLERLSAEIGRRGFRLGARAEERLLAYAFPGNVRELRNILERALVLEAGPTLQLELLDGSPQAASDDATAFRVSDGPITMEELERRYARHVLRALGGRRMDAAVALGLSYPTFLKRLGE